MSDVQMKTVRRDISGGFGPASRGNVRLPDVIMLNSRSNGSRHVRDANRLRSTPLGYRRCPCHIAMAFGSDLQFADRQFSADRRRIAMAYEKRYVSPVVSITTRRISSSRGIFRNA